MADERWPLQRRYSTTRSGQRLHARVSDPPHMAERPAVVLVHGLLVSSRYMVRLAMRLAPFTRVFAPDLPQYGRSAKPANCYSVPNLADALLEWMDAYSLPSATLVANSYGCQVAANLAMRYPERVERLVLLGPTVDPKRRSAAQVIGWWLLNVPFEPIGLVLVCTRDFLDMGPVRLWHVFWGMLDDHIEYALPHVRAETLLVRGAWDFSVLPDWFRQAANLLPRCRTAEIPGRPHTIPYNSPSEVAQLVREFLRVEAPPRRAG